MSIIESIDRNVKISPELMETWATRDTDGNLLTWNWGEPDDDGFYCPEITCHADDNLVSKERERIAKLEGLREYATHKPGCHKSGNECICGLDALLTIKTVLVYKGEEHELK